MKTASRRSAAAAPEDDATRIYRAIFESVMSQRLAPGTKLREAALCELFGVGRTVIRKVLQALASLAHAGWSAASSAAVSSRSWRFKAA